MFICSITVEMRTFCIKIATIPTCFMYIYFSYKMSAPRQYWYVGSSVWKDWLLGPISSLFDLFADLMCWERLCPAQPWVCFLLSVWVTLHCICFSASQCSSLFPSNNCDWKWGELVTALTTTTCSHKNSTSHPSGKFLSPPSCWRTVSVTVFRGFWTVLMVLGLVSALTGGFLLVCGVPFISHKLYKLGGAFFIIAGKI